MYWFVGEVHPPRECVIHYHKSTRSGRRVVHQVGDANHRHEDGHYAHRRDERIGVRIHDRSMNVRVGVDQANAKCCDENEMDVRTW